MHNQSGVGALLVTGDSTLPDLEVGPDQFSQSLITLSVEEFALPTAVKPIQPFLVTTYLVADALASRSRQLLACRVQTRHLSIQALNLTVQLNDAVDSTGGATEEQYEEGFDLDKSVKWSFVELLLTSHFWCP